MFNDADVAEVRRQGRQLARKYKASKTLRALAHREPVEHIIKTALDELDADAVVDVIETADSWDWEHGERCVTLPDLSASQSETLTDAIVKLANQGSAVMWAYRSLKQIPVVPPDQRARLVHIIVQSKWDMILRDALVWLPRVTEDERKLFQRALADLPPESE